MTDKQAQFITNISPLRTQIVEIIGKNRMTTLQIAQCFEGYSRERMLNILRGMAESKLVSRETIADGSVMWFAYKAPKKIKRTKPLLNGTTKGRLSLGYMQTSYRAGSMDAYAIASGGV
jgi:alpha-L-fucosidase